MVFRRRDEPTDPLAGVDPAAVSPRFADDVLDARAAADRYASILARTDDGPVRDRLAALTGEVHGAVRAVFAAALATDRRLATLEDLRPDDVARRLKDARRALARAEDDGRDASALRATAESLDRQLGSVHAVWNAVESAEAELHRLQLRLGEVVALAGALAAEVAVTRAPTSRLDEVGTELRALREALEELGG